VAVAAFLNRDIAFAEIPKVIERTMNETPDRHPESIEEVLAIDVQARDLARQLLTHQPAR
jgi:1-deoxy-D-xylulose-5-phosphate reductoisomerase